MTSTLFECVPNISEGRDPARIDAVQAAISGVPGTLLLHRTSDVDHHRSVITFAGPRASVAEAALCAVRAAAERIDLTTHRGVHPRLGALDVLPFVPLDGASLVDCVALAHETGNRIWRELGIPVYFYEAAALRPDRQRLEDVRRGQFEGLRDAVLNEPAKQPDLGGPALHSTAGAVIVGARKILIAYNINLRSTDLSVAKFVASRIRERNGGLPGVKALGLPLSSQGMVQVSINITDHERSPLPTVYEAVAELAASRGVEIEESELIGLMPRSALGNSTAEVLKLKDFSADRLIESRIADWMRAEGQRR